MSTGVCERVYLANMQIGKGPSVVSPKEEAAQTRDRFIDGSLAVDSLALPWSGAPAVVEKRTWTISWEDLSALDILRINRLVATRGVLAFDFVPWLYWHESFLITAGSARSGVLSRRSALAVVTDPPPTADTKYATLSAHGWEDLAAWTELGVTLGTAVGNRTPWTAAGTPSTPEFVVISYCPAYRVVVGESQESFTLPAGQNQTLTLEEV